jgi:hypothetical protein
MDEHHRATSLMGHVEGYGGLAASCRTGEVNV